MIYVLIFIGAGIGGALRQAVNVAAAKFFSLDFPFGTLTVNVVGSFLMGAIVAVFALRADLPEVLKLFLTTGILGGFTTFSTFSLDSVELWERGQPGVAVAYIGVSLVLSLAGLVFGMAVIRLLDHVFLA